MGTTTAKLGPLTVRLEGAPIPASTDDRAEHFPAWALERRSEKLVQRWALDVGEETIITNAPFFYGTADDVRPADPLDLLMSVLTDVSTIVSSEREPHGPGTDKLTRWAQWAEDLGLFSDATTAADVRGSIRAFETADAWRELLVERIGEDTLDDMIRAGQLLDCELLDALRLDGDDPVAGEWTAHGLAEFVGASVDAVRLALGALAHAGRVGDRYVGGTSGILYSAL